MHSLGLAWATGFFEGDGNARLTVSRRLGSIGSDGYVAKRNYRYPDISARNADPSLLENLKNQVNCGSVLGPYRNIGYGRGWIYLYSVRGKLAEHVARLLWPFCVSKSKQNQLSTVIKRPSRSISDVGKEERLAWLAGFFGAEGCAFAYFHRHGKLQHGYLNPKVSIANTQCDVLDRIKTITGCGLVSLSGPLQEGYLPIYRFTAECESARRFARLIRSYVVSDLKRMQLDEIEVNG